MTIYKILGILLIIFFLVLIMYIIIWGTSLPTFTFQKLMLVLIPIFIAIIWFMGLINPLHFSVFSILLLLPLIGIVLPPRRLGISTFDIFAGLILFSIIYCKLFKNENIKIFLNSFTIIPIICLLPSFLTTIDFGHTFYIFVKILGYYIFYVALIYFLNNSKNALLKINFLLMLTLWIISCFIFLEKIWGIKLSFTGLNLNALSYIDGLQIRRAAGLFQDPQKVAQFIGCFFVYFVVLLVRGYFNSFKTKFFVIITLFVSFIALIWTISRLALVSTILGSLFAILVLNKFDFLKKLITVCIFFVLMVLFSSLYHFKDILPLYIQKRFERVENSMQNRLNIWKDSWKIFKAPSLTGIGLGNYQNFLVQKDPYYKKLKERGEYVPNQPENGYLKILYEAGIIGILGGLYFIIGILYYTYYNLFKTTKEGLKTITLATLMGFFVFFSTFLTLYTISDARNALIPVLLFSFLSSRGD